MMIVQDRKDAVKIANSMTARKLSTFKSIPSKPDEMLGFTRTDLTL